MSPASQELAQSRLLAERAFFYLKRMPLLLNWQVQSVIVDTLAQPEMQRIVEAAERLTAAGERLSTVAEDLSVQLPKEREAAVEQALEGLRRERKAILGTFEREEVRLGGLLEDLRVTIDSATALSASINTTLESTERLRESFGSDRPANVERRPFNVVEYQAAAEALTVTAEEFNRLVLSLHELLALPAWEERRGALSDATDRTQAGLEQLIDRGYRRGFALIAVIIGGALVAALTYRVLISRLSAPRAERMAGAER